ncbi:MAG TPA: ABC transporter substrate-binding protein [Polyangiaceae bacterium]|nr:ABC transporter substrate-binding protein [Polyangiaceae bacterium]
MKALAFANGAAFALALGSSAAVAWVPGCQSRTAMTQVPAAPPAAPDIGPTGRAANARATASGRNFRRIVSGSTIADALLVELCEPDRIAAFTSYGAHHAVGGYRYAGKPTVDRLEDLEAVLALRPDLVLVNTVGDPRPIDRLREAGAVVYDLGEMRGLVTLIPNVHEMAELVGHPERGDRLARALVEQMHAVASDVPIAARRSALYVSAYGSKLFGGASGTSYHDVLGAAGFRDAASAYRDSPEYSAEQILIANPDIIVTNSGMRARICGHTGLDTLRACTRNDGIIELDDGLLGDPGPAMVDAARQIRTAAYGSPPSM